jgi:hypothetical protein
MFKLNPSLAASLAALITLLAALPAAADTVDARVVGLYVETAPGLYLERAGDYAALRNGIDKSQLRAEVRVSGIQGAPARMLMVRVGDLDLRTGDLVEVNPGERGNKFITGVRPTKPFVVRLQARGDTVLVDNGPARSLVERLFVRNQ